MPTDAELLRRYADEKSEVAFGELVRRQVNLVYSVALRQCGGDAHLAEDVTQRVFTDLARKARPLAGYAVLGGWLYRSAQFAASDVVRAERRRRAREQEAQAMQEISHSAASDADWQKLAPVLDRAIGDLDARDRDAVVLRFFEGRPFGEIGATLRLTEDAARMRVERALDKLRAALVRRGITSTTAALSVALANQAAAIAPAELAASVTGMALASAAKGGIAATVGVLAFMSGTKFTMGVAGVVTVLSLGTAVYQNQRADGAESALTSVNQERDALNVRLAGIEGRARLAEKRADDAEKDSGELLRAVEAFRTQASSQLPQNNAAASVPGDSSSEQVRLAYERAYAQDMAKRRATEARTRATIAEEVKNLDPVQKFNRLLQVAEQHAAQGEFQFGMRMWNEAMAAKPADLPLSDSAQQLHSTLVAESEPVDISIRSDEKTFVAIAGFRALGMTGGSSSVKIAPGNYEIVGWRQGYQDVVIPVQVRGGSPRPMVNIACTVPVTP